MVADAALSSARAAAPKCANYLRTVCIALFRRRHGLSESAWRRGAALCAHPRAQACQHRLEPGAALPREKRELSRGASRMPLLPQALRA